jgi:hypothetical protein
MSPGFLYELHRKSMSGKNIGEAGLLEEADAQFFRTRE